MDYFQSFSWRDLFKKPLWREDLYTCPLCHKAYPYLSMKEACQKAHALKTLRAYQKKFLQVIKIDRFKTDETRHLILCGGIYLNPFNFLMYKKKDKAIESLKKSLDEWDIDFEQQYIEPIEIPIHLIEDTPKPAAKEKNKADKKAAAAPAAQAKTQNATPITQQENVESVGVQFKCKTCGKTYWLKPDALKCSHQK